MAQLVSREHLLQLLKADGKVEESENSFSYSDFCKWHAECIEDGKRLDFRGELDDSEDKYSFAYDKVKETYLESKCPPIKFAGQGSSRAAFALAGGKCLKIATNAKGVAQNKQELKNTSDESYMCFTKNYSNADDFTSLLTECCAKAQQSDFMRMFSMSITDLKDLISFVTVHKGIDAALKQLNDDYSQMRNPKNDYSFIGNDMLKDLQQFSLLKIKLLKDVKSRKAPQTSVLADLLEFYRRQDWMTDELLLDDLENLDNWGLAVRDSELCLIVLDVGFSKSVAQLHY